jgi:hypothetical protein
MNIHVPDQTTRARKTSSNGLIFSSVRMFYTGGSKECSVQMQANFAVQLDS